jgi:predicted acetyltransferase
MEAGMIGDRDGTVAVDGVSLQRVAAGERAALDDMVDVHLAELAGHRERAVGAVDAASYEYLPLYWEEAGRHPYFIETEDGQRVGFVLVRELAAEGLTEISEFHVLAAARRAGCGRRALALVWRLFPGRWRLQVHAQNEPAMSFWHRFIHEAANGEVVRREITEDDGRRFEYLFDIAAR